MGQVSKKRGQSGVKSGPGQIGYLVGISAAGQTLTQIAHYFILERLQLVKVKLVDRLSELGGKQD